MDTTIAVQNALFEGLTFHDIFIGNNGLVVLVASMILALAGNLFKKYRRFITVVESEKKFDVKYWLMDNAFSMVVGFFMTYFAVRLLNVITPIVMSLDMVKQYIPDPSKLHLSELLIVVSLVIGYYVDKFEPKLPLHEILNKETPGKQTGTDERID